jgi:hypothetical protein
MKSKIIFKKLYQIIFLELIYNYFLKANKNKSINNISHNVNYVNNFSLLLKNKEKFDAPK